MLLLSKRGHLFRDRSGLLARLVENRVHKHAVTIPACGIHRLDSNIPSVVSWGFRAAFEHPEHGTSLAQTKECGNAP